MFVLVLVHQIMYICLLPVQDVDMVDQCSGALHEYGTTLVVTGLVRIWYTYILRLAACKFAASLLSQPVPV
jgi:hypothetical protein